MTSDLLIGIASGVVASVLVWLSVWTGRRYLAPGARRALYNGPDISGDWFTYHSHDPFAAPVGKATLRQRGDSIQGKVTAVQNRERRESNKVFEVSGFLRSGQLALTYEEEQLKGYVLGAGVFKLAADGKSMVGRIDYAHHDRGDITSYEFAFRRP